MAENFDFCLSSKCVKNLPLDKYDQNFTFIVNGKQYQTSRVIADLLSPRIRKLHYIDPSINEFVIETNNDNDTENYFEEFLSLSTFQKSSIDKKRQQVFKQYFYSLGNIDEYFRLQSDYLQTLSADNILDNLLTFSKARIEFDENTSQFSSVFDKMVEFASEHFEELDKEKMKKLPIEIIEEIIQNEKLKLCEEDSLLDFVLNLYDDDRSYSILFEKVLFSNVSEEKLKKFVDEFDVEYINNTLFHSICKRFFKDKNDDSINESRYTNSNSNDKNSDIKEFKPKESEDFDGILRYLTNKTGGNIHDNGTIEISSNSICNHPKNALDYNNTNIYHSNNDGNSYVSIDFKDKAIQISSYSIQSASGNTVHMKNWAIEVSDDNSNWQEIDRRSGDSNLNGMNNKSRFDCKNPQTKFYRFIRLRQTGDAWYQNYIGFTYIELYGKLQESKT